MNRFFSRKSMKGYLATAALLAGIFYAPALPFIRVAEKAVDPVYESVIDPLNELIIEQTESKMDKMVVKEDTDA